jgi:hypothetical protein
MNSSFPAANNDQTEIDLAPIDAGRLIGVEVVPIAPADAPD